MNKNDIENAAVISAVKFLFNMHGRLENAHNNKMCHVALKASDRDLEEYGDTIKELRSLAWAENPTTADDFLADLSAKPDRGVNALLIRTANFTAKMLTASFGLAATQAMAQVERPPIDVLTSLRNRKCADLADVLTNPAGPQKHVM